MNVYFYHQSNDLFFKVKINDNLSYKYQNQAKIISFDKICLFMPYLLIVL